MTPNTTLLVTTDPSVINYVQQLHDETDHSQLEVCGRLEKVPNRLSLGKSLLIIHSDPSIDPKSIQTILEFADRSLVKATVVWLSTPDHNAQPPEFGSYPVYQLPRDLPALREILVSVQAATSRSLHGPSLPIDQMAPITKTLLSDLSDQIDTIRRVARQTTTILLTGETGSGKSMMTKFIHAASPRRDEPYLVVDCGALSGHLIESEMFGHVRGAFTGAERDRQGKFAAAGVGTLVLDEINSLPLPLQIKLLRAVEERLFEPVGSNKSEPLRARIIAVSNVPLEEEIRKERFRVDLYYRLNVVEFRIPPLRERPGAVIPLAHQLLRSSATAACQGVTAISPAALDLLIGYQWPGNVRELRNVIEGAAALASGPVIQINDLPESIRRHTATQTRHVALPTLALPSPPEPIDSVLVTGNDEMSRILAVLRKHNNNRRQAAAELGISRVSLYKKLHKSGLFARKHRVQTIE